jgi:hypothetical protein
MIEYAASRLAKKKSEGVPPVLVTEPEALKS